VIGDSHRLLNDRGTW